MEIRLQNISFYYKLLAHTHLALRDITVRISSGEFLAVIGPSGCGKSTLLNLVGGFLQPTHGSILINGKQVPGPGPDRIMIFQSSGLFPFQTALQNIEFGLLLQGVPAEERKARSQEMLAAVALAEFANAYPKELSEGMKKLVEIARALVVSSPVILFDEPLASLDALSRFRMHQYLQKLLEADRPTILWVTHDIEEAVMLADRVLVMSPNPGRVITLRDVGLPRPRTETMRSSEAVQSTRRELLELLSGSAA